MQDTLFTHCGGHQLTDFDATELHDLQTGLYSIDFSADSRLVFNVYTTPMIGYEWKVYFVVATFKLVFRLCTEGLPSVGDTVF